MNRSSIHASDISYPEASFAHSGGAGSDAYDGSQEDQQVNFELNENSTSRVSASTEQPSIEHVQQQYYVSGLEELESLQLLDVSPLATWKLSSFKPGYGLAQLREDSPDSYWQSDGSSDNNMGEQTSSECNTLNHPHSVTLQFSKKVSLERLSLFTNYQLDESYTPQKIKIMAGGSNWDLTEVCTVPFDKPIGWSHIIFKGVRADGLLKCFVVKIIILSNHQDGKDSHIRALRCFSKKAATTFIAAPPPDLADRVARQTSFSGLELNSHDSDGSRRADSFGDDADYECAESFDAPTAKVLSNVRDVIGFNSGFDSLELKSVSSIR